MAQTEAAAPAVDTAFVEDFFPRWLDAWNSHDADRLLALMTEDITYDDSAWPKTMHGHADVREFLRHAWTGCPDMRFEVKDGPFLHPTKPSATSTWTGFATHTGPIDPPGIAPTGKHVTFEGFDLHEYRDGKVHGFGSASTWPPSRATWACCRPSGAGPSSCGEAGQPADPAAPLGRSRRHSQRSVRGASRMRITRAGHAADDGVVGHVLRHHGARAEDAVVADA